VFDDPKGYEVKKGEIFRFDSESENPGNSKRVHLPHPEIIIASEVGHKLLVDDGKVALTVVEKGIDYLDCLVENDGIIKDRKGVNTPDSIMDISPMTEKDRLDLKHMLGLGVDWVALSFVQREQVSERSERALMKTRIRATTKLNIILIFLARSPPP